MVPGVDIHQLWLGLFLSVIVIEPIAATMVQLNGTSMVELASAIQLSLYLMAMSSPHLLSQ